MEALTKATMINNKILFIISSKFYHAELIGNHHFSIYGKIKRKYLRKPPSRTFNKQKVNMS